MSDFGGWADRLSDDYIKELEHSDWGPLSFAAIRRPLELIRGQLRTAREQGDYIPTPQAQEAVAKLAQLETTLTAIANYDPKTTPGTQQDQLIAQVEAVKDGILQALRPYVHAPDQGASMDGAQARALVENLNEAASRATDAKRALEPVLTRAQQQNLEVAGADAAAFFDSEALFRDDAARKFLLATSVAVGLLTAAAITFLVWFQMSPPEYPNLGDALAGLLPKVTLLLVLSFAVGFCARNYRVNSHLSVLNRTKAITIRSAKNYAASVDEPSHRDLVVASLVQSVYALGDTGYLPIDSERTIIETPGAGALFNAARPSVSQ